MNSIAPIMAPHFRVVSLREAADIVKEVRTQEIYIQSKNLRFLTSGCLQAGKYQWPLTDGGLGTLYHYLKIPVQYAGRIPLDLLTTNINRLLKETDREILIKVQQWPGMPVMAITCITGGKYRTLLYRVLINSLETVQNNIGYKIERINLCPSLFRSEFTLGEPLDILPNDFYRFGSEIIASENAWNQSVSIRSYLFRLVCTNGLILPYKLFDYYSFKPVCTLRTQELMSLLENAIKGTCRPSKNIKEVLRIDAQKNMSEAHSYWLHQRLHGKLSVEMLKSYIPEKLIKKTYYEIINEVTAQAHQVNNLVLQRYFQLLGGEILELIITKN